MSRSIKSRQRTFSRKIFRLLLLILACVCTRILYNSAPQTKELQPLEVRERTSIDNIPVQIVIVTHDALQYAKQGLTALKDHTDWNRATLHIVDSGSSRESLSWFSRFCSNSFCTLHNIGNQGYTKAVNIGLRHSQSKYVVVMNPDVVVCKHWLDKLFKALHSCPSHALVGPLSNAASFQSVPRSFDAMGDLFTNQLAKGMQVEEMCRLVDTVSAYDFPDATFINGFLMLFKRQAFHDVGLFDEINFPVGYGEENDFALRLLRAGYTLAVADNTYAYHFKTTGFSQDKRKTLSKAGSDANKKKYGKEYLDLHISYMKTRDSHFLTRQRISHALHEKVRNLGNWIDLKVVFVLPRSEIDKNTETTLHVVSSLRHYGVQVTLAVRQDSVGHFQRVSQHFPEPSLVSAYSGLDGLLKICKSAHAVVATTPSSVKDVLFVRKVYPQLLLAYYIQDEGNHLYNDLASLSFQNAAEEQILCFVKSREVKDLLITRYAVKAVHVIPSIIHDAHARGECSSDTVRVSALLRKGKEVKTDPTQKLLSTLKHRLGSAVDTRILQIDDDEVISDIAKSEAVNTISMLLETDILIDLSSLRLRKLHVECMISRCIPVVSNSECHIHTKGNNAMSELCVDFSNMDEAFEKIESLVSSGKEKLRLLKMTASTQASDLAVEESGRVIYGILRKQMKANAA